MSPRARRATEAPPSTSPVEPTPTPEPLLTSEAEPAPTSWRNRITGSGLEAPDQLLANPDNWRIHPRPQQDALGAVLDTVGWVQQIIVNQQTGHVVDGHLRVSLALAREEPLVPVVYVDLSPEEERVILAAYDSITGLAGTDAEKLKALLAASAESMPDLTKILTDAIDFGDDVMGTGQPPSDGSLLALVEVTVAEPRHQVAHGDVWQIGKHRLVLRDPEFEHDEVTPHYDALRAHGPTVLAHYPGMCLATTRKALEGTYRICMVLKDPYAAGKLLDHAEETLGGDAILQIEHGGGEDEATRPTRKRKRASA